MASDCSVCRMNYDENEHRPRVLPCGHTYCTKCIVTLIGRGNDNLLCPGCRTFYPDSVVNNFPINYVVESLMKEMQLNLETATITQDQSEESSKGINEKMRWLLNEKKNNLMSVISNCLNNQAQISQYITLLEDWKKRHLGLNERLGWLLRVNGDAMSLIEIEEAKVRAIKQQGEDKHQQLKYSLESLQSVNTAKEVVMAIDDSDQCIVDVENWKKKYQERFPDPNTLIESLKVCDGIEDALVIAKQAIDKNYRPPQPDPSHTIMSKVKMLSLSRTDKQLTVRDLCSMKESIDSLIDAGQVMAVHEVRGQIQYSKISINNCKVYMHCLQDYRPQQNSPINTYTVKVSDVMSAMNKLSMLVFLDIGYRSLEIPLYSPLPDGRVHIRLRGNTPLAQQFWLLCTGQIGVSYLQSTLFKIEHHGKNGETVCFGDYERKNGRGGAGIIDTTSTEGQYGKSGMAGAVLGMPNSPARSAQFAIITRDCWDADTHDNVFGDVVSGLHHLMKVAMHNDTNFIVADCGIVLQR